MHQAAVNIPASTPGRAFTYVGPMKVIRFDELPRLADGELDMPEFSRLFRDACAELDVSDLDRWIITKWHSL